MDCMRFWKNTEARFCLFADKYFGVSGIGTRKPCHGVDLYSATPHFPMQMRAGGAACCSAQSDQLPGLNRVSGLTQDLGEMIVSRVDAPAMINHNHSAAHDQHVRVHNLAGRGRVEFRSDPAAEIQPAMKEIIRVQLCNCEYRCSKSTYGTRAKPTKYAP